MNVVIFSNRIFISNFTYNLLGLDIRRKLFRQIHDNIGGKVRFVISGAAGIDPVVSKGFRSFGISLLQGYGLTECSPRAIIHVLYFSA